MGTGQYLVEAVLVEGRTISEVARSHGVSRRWVQKLLTRYRELGEEGLVAKSRRPHSSPNATLLETEDAVVLLRKELVDLGLDAGPRTISYHLAKRVAIVPSIATISRILKRRGFVTPQPQKRPKSSYIRFVASLPNELWQSDFTHWQLRDGTDVEILNFLDDHSRFAFSSIAYQSVTAVSVVEQFRNTAAKFGIPQAMLTDNGRVYTTSRYGAKVLIEQELERLGVVYKHGRPYHPQTQGKIERWHQTLKIFLGKQPPAPTIKELQVQLDKFLLLYNEKRPHTSLNNQTPKEVWNRKIKAHPTGALKINPELRVRKDKVDSDGRVTLRRHSKMHHIYLGKAHKGTPVKMLVDDLDVRIITFEGELLRHFALDPTCDYQPMNSGRVT